MATKSFATVFLLLTSMCICMSSAHISNMFEITIDGRMVFSEQAPPTSIEQKEQTEVVAKSENKNSMQGDVVPVESLEKESPKQDKDGSGEQQGEVQKEAIQQKEDVPAVQPEEKLEKPEAKEKGTESSQQNEKSSETQAEKEQPEAKPLESEDTAARATQSEEERPEAKQEEIDPQQNDNGSAVKPAEGNRLTEHKDEDKSVETSEDDADDDEAQLAKEDDEEELEEEAEAIIRDLVQRDEEVVECIISEEEAGKEQEEGKNVKKSVEEAGTEDDKSEEKTGMEEANDQVGDKSDKTASEVDNKTKDPVSEEFPDIEVIGKVNGPAEEDDDVTIGCPSDWLNFQDEVCFHAIEEPKRTFFHGNGECGRLHANFTSIHSMDEFRFITDHFDLRHFWIGIFRGSKRFMDGTVVDWPLFRQFDPFVPWAFPTVQKGFICRRAFGKSSTESSHPQEDKVESGGQQSEAKEEAQNEGTEQDEDGTAVQPEGKLEEPESKEEGKEMAQQNEDSSETKPEG